MTNIRAFRCPGCGTLPALKLDAQYWCGNDECLVLTWDPTQDPAKFKATAKTISLDEFMNVTRGLGGEQSD